MAGVAEVAEANGDTVNGNSVAGLTKQTIITVRNADAGGPHTVTFLTNAEVGGFAVADHPIAIAASTTRKFSGFDPKVFGRTLVIEVDSTQLKIQAMQS